MQRRKDRPLTRGIEKTHWLSPEQAFRQSVHSMNVVSHSLAFSIHLNLKKKMDILATFIMLPDMLSKSTPVKNLQIHFE